MLKQLKKQYEEKIQNCSEQVANIDEQINFYYANCEEDEYFEKTNGLFDNYNYYCCIINRYKNIILKIEEIEEEIDCIDEIKKFYKNK